MKTYICKVTDEAESDVKKIYEWYKSKLQGLGKRFLSHVEKSFNKIAINPLAFANTGFLRFQKMYT